MKLVEIVITLVLGLLLLTGVWRGAAAVRTQAQRIGSEAAEWDALRVAGLLLDLEAAGFAGEGRPGELAVRASRWWGRVCALPATGAPRPVTVRWRGLRRPDPAKDSVLLVLADGWTETRLLRAVSGSTRCPGPGVLDLDLEGPPPEGVPVLVRGFERGAYRIDDAFRYRRGAGGAQPLTAPVFPPDSTRLGVQAGRVRLRVPGRLDRVWSW